MRTEAVYRSGNRENPGRSRIFGSEIRSVALSLVRLRERVLPTADIISISLSLASVSTASSRSENRAAVRFASMCRTLSTVTGSSFANEWKLSRKGVE